MRRLIDAVSQAIRIPSFSDEEEAFANYLVELMTELDFDEVAIDSTGNVYGVIGQGPLRLQFDGHLDTVRVDDADQWKYPPFSGQLAEGAVWGRGSVDMKSGLICAIYAAAEAKSLGLLKEKQVLITGTVCEEYCDGVNLERFYESTGIRPEAVIICEPSGNRLALGHKGKAQLRITTHGLSAHGSAPEKGVNAIYRMAPIIQRIEELNQQLKTKGDGTIVLSNISSVSASLNAVPSSCTIYVDRRLGMDESLAQVEAEMNSLIRDVDATWQVGTLVHHSWTGQKLLYQPMHEPWRIEPSHPLTKTLQQAVEAAGCDPGDEIYWDFGTNAITPVAMGLPTIGLGPGDYKLAHMVDEHCPVAQLEDAQKIYLELIRRYE